VPAITVLLATYNQPQWLEWALWGYATQTFRDFELVIVDDGSGPETRERIDTLRPQLPFRLRHFWQPDEGFQKCRALNCGIRLAETDYIVFSDGDCIPHPRFLERHMQARQPGRFLSGGYCKLPLTLSQAITRADVLEGRATDYHWLAANGLERHTLKLRVQREWQRRLLNRLTTVRPNFHGHNASAWKADLLRVNGFDERMQYGKEDIEIGDRLKHAGVHGIQIRYTTVCVHLEHGRGYVTDAMRKRNAAIRAETVRSRSVWTPHGIDLHQAESLQAY
jgi:glycosyltransferase involved in cell wall biosynthesis